MSGSRYDVAWRKKYEELKEFERREGHCNVSRTLNGYQSLANWVKKQRLELKKQKEGKPSRLTRERIEALEDIGFQWRVRESVPKDEFWFKKYEELKEFKNREGHCNVPQEYHENKSLGIWVMTQRKQYKNMRAGKSPSITEPKIRMLEKIGFLWRVKDPNDDAWCKKYEELKDFKSHVGHCNVPQRYEARSLGIWVTEQRVQYKNMKEGNSPSIPESRIILLEKIGFQWSLRSGSLSLDEESDDAWHKKYAELRQFRCLKGHCNVPRQYRANLSLAKWVSKQRLQFRNMAEGEPSSMTDLRIQALEDIGFSWNVSNTTKVPEKPQPCTIK